MRAWPWSALVLVQSPGVSRCTGFLLDGRTIVTAAHCLYAGRVRHLVRPESLHVLSFYDGGAFAAHSVATGFKVPVGWDMLHQGETRGLDVAVLTLVASVGSRGLALASAAPGQAAMLGGYERDRAQVLLADPACRVMGVLADASGHFLRQHSCAGTYGTSGAPLLVRAGADWAAAGVQVAAEGDAAGGVAVPASVVAALIASK